MNFSFKKLCIALVLAFAAGGIQAQQLKNLSNLILEPASASAESSASISLARAPDVNGETIEEIKSSIQSLRQSDPDSPELAEQLGLLGLSYQTLGQHQEAIDTLTEAVLLSVKANGEDTFTQIPLLEQRNQSYLLLNDLDSVAENKALIHSLYMNNFGPGDIESYAATAFLADWYITSYFRDNYRPGEPLRLMNAALNRTQRQIMGGGSEEVDASEGTGGMSSDIGRAIFNGNIKDVNDMDVTDSRLRRTDTLYQSYQQQLFDSGKAQLDIVMDIAKRITGLAYITKQEMDYERDGNFYVPEYDGSREEAVRNSPDRRDESYDSGRNALVYIVDLLRSVEGVPANAVARSLIELADWHLAYGKLQPARENYQEAYRVLQDAGYTVENIDLALSSELPQRIPLSATYLYTRKSTGLDSATRLQNTGYIDLSMAVDSQGNATDVRFLGNSGQDTSAIEDLLALQLKSMKFRPVLRGGELAPRGEMNLRYFYAY